jgi:chromosome segregation ATPase
MATLDDEERSLDAADDDAGMGIAVGCPSYGDLVEENSYLRSEVCRFYEQSAVRPSSPITKCPTDLLVRMKELEDEIAEEKCQKSKSKDDIDRLQSELIHLQAHTLDQAAAAQILGQKAEEVEYELHLANAELLQILPLRMKLTESNKKIEALRGEILMAGNEILNIGLTCDQMSAQNDLSHRRCEELQKISDDLNGKLISAKAEMAGKNRAQLINQHRSYGLAY